MKKLLFLILAFCSSVAAMAQNGHLEFKGVPIDGNIDNFVSELKKQGFEELHRLDAGAIMKGNFTGKDANIYILPSAKTKTVWKVSAQFGEDESWQDLKSYYFEYVKLYASKYGEPSNHFEFFSSPYYEGDGYELQALRKDKCNYLTAFELSNGVITISITTQGKVSLSYEDSKNAEIMKQEKKSNALDDI